MAGDACSAPAKGAQEKACTKCGVVKPLSAFAKSSQTKSGVRAACKACACAAEAIKRAARNIVPLGTMVPCTDCGADYAKRSGPSKRCEPCAVAVRVDSHRAANARYEERRTEPRKRCPVERRQANQRYSERHPERARARNQRYNEANRDEINRKSRERNQTPEGRRKRREWEATYGSLPKVRLDRRMKTAISQSLKGNKAGRSWEALVGYTLDDLMIHIERQFLDGMSWENIGEWHIDHIIPKSVFQYEDPADDEFGAAWALTNLRPLWAADNMSKGAKRLFLI